MDSQTIMLVDDHIMDLFALEPFPTNHKTTAFVGAFYKLLLGLSGQDSTPSNGTEIPWHIQYRPTRCYKSVPSRADIPAEIPSIPLNALIFACLLLLFLLVGASFLYTHKFRKDLYNATHNACNEVTRLEKRLATVQGLARKAKTECNALKRRNDSLVGSEETAQALEARIEAARREISELSNQLSAARKAVALAEKAVAEKEKECEKLKKSKGEAEETVVDLQAQIQSFRQEKEQNDALLNARIQDLSAANDKLKSSKKSDESEKAALLADKNKLEKSSQDLSEQLRAERVKSAQFETENLELVKKCGNMRGEISELRAQKEDVQATYVKIVKDTAVEHDKELQVKKRQISEVETEKEELEASIVRLTNTNTMLENEPRGANTKLDNTREQYDGEIEKLKATIADLQQENQLLQSRLEEASSSQRTAAAGSGDDDGEEKGDGAPGGHHDGEDGDDIGAESTASDLPSKIQSDASGVSNQNAEADSTAEDSESLPPPPGTGETADGTDPESTGSDPESTNRYDDGMLDSAYQILDLPAGEVPVRLPSSATDDLQNSASVESHSWDLDSIDPPGANHLLFQHPITAISPGDFAIPLHPPQQPTHCPLGRPHADCGNLFFQCPGFEGMSHTHQRNYQRRFRRERDRLGCGVAAFEAVCPQDSVPVVADTKVLFWRAQVLDEEAGRVRLPGREGDEGGDGEEML